MSATENVTDDVGVDGETDIVEVPDEYQNISDDVLDDVDVLTTLHGTYADLNNEIANAKDELILTRDYIGSDISKCIYINNTGLTINGNGHYIDGNNLYEGIVVTGQNVILKNITFEKCTRAIYWQGFYGSLYDCKFINCKNSNPSTPHVLTQISTIVHLPAPITIENCSFINCLAYESTLHVYDEFSINNCSFTDCFSRTSGSGSASSTGVVNCGKKGEIKNCNFVNCSASTTSSGYDFDPDFSAYGGAIYWSGPTKDSSIMNCTFINCSTNSNIYTSGPHDSITSGAYGGAIFMGGTNAIIENCKFINCFSSSSVAGESKEIFVLSYGGAIFIFSANVSIMNCKFDNNIAKDGGAIVIDSNSKYATIADIKNCTFTNNVAENAGAIYKFNNITSISNCKFIDNSAYVDAGALYFIGNYEYLSDCIFENNKANNNGGAIVWDGNDGTITSSVFLNNSANKDDGIYINGANNIVKDSVLFSATSNPVIYSELYVTTTNYNWWGNTVANYNQKPATPSKVNVKNWLFLNVTANTTSLKIGEIATVNCDLTYLTTSNGAISKYYLFDFPIMNLTIESDNVNDSILMVDGLCKNTYVATNVPTGFLTVKYNYINETINFTIDKGDLKLNVSDTIILNGNLLINASNKANGLINVTIDNQIYSGDMINGNAFIPIKNLTIGKYLATVTFEGDLYNVDVFNTYVNIKSSINASDLTKSQDSDAKFQATFFDFNVNVLKNTKVTFMLNNGLQTIITDNNGVATLNIDLPIGNYDITLLNPVTDEIKVNQIVITSPSNNPIIENNTNNNTNISDGNITNSNATDINNTDNVTGENTTCTNITNATGGNASETNTTKPTPEVVIPPLDKPSDDRFVIISLPDDATGKITLTVGGKDYVFDVVDGKADVKLPELDNGDYLYTIKYSGDGKYSSFVDSGSLKVNNTAVVDDKTSENKTDANATEPTVKPDVVIPPLDKPSSDGSVTISLPTDATGKVTLTINGKDYNYLVENGVANVIIPNLGDGNYPYTITYSGDSKYSSFTNTGSLKVNKTTVNPVENQTNTTGNTSQENTTIVDNSKIVASNKKVTYATGKYYTIKVYGEDGQLANGVEVVITVKGKTFKTLTTKDGVAKFKVTQKPGTYKMTITALNKNVTKTLTVKHLVTLKAVAVKKSAKKLTLQASLGKVNGKYLNKKTVTFKFNGKKYTAKTNKKGVAKLTIKHAKSGKNTYNFAKLKVGKKVTYHATYSKDTVKKTVKVKK